MMFISSFEKDDNDDWDEMTLIHQGKVDSFTELMKQYQEEKSMNYRRSLKTKKIIFNNWSCNHDLTPTEEIIDIFQEWVNDGFTVELNLKSRDLGFPSFLRLIMRLCDIGCQFNFFGCSVHMTLVVSMLLEFMEKFKIENSKQVFFYIVEGWDDITQMLGTDLMLFIAKYSSLISVNTMIPPSATQLLLDQFFQPNVCFLFLEVSNVGFYDTLSKLQCTAHELKINCSGNMPTEFVKLMRGHTKKLTITFSKITCKDLTVVHNALGDHRFEFLHLQHCKLKCYCQEVGQEPCDIFAKFFGRVDKDLSIDNAWLSEYFSPIEFGKFYNIVIPALTDHVQAENLSFQLYTQINDEKEIAGLFSEKLFERKNNFVKHLKVTIPGLKQFTESFLLLYPMVERLHLDFRGSYSFNFNPLLKSLTLGLEQFCPATAPIRSSDMPNLEELIIQNCRYSFAKDCLADPWEKLQKLIVYEFHDDAIETLIEFGTQLVPCRFISSCESDPFNKNIFFNVYGRAVFEKRIKVVEPLLSTCLPRFPKELVATILTMVYTDDPVSQP